MDWASIMQKNILPRSPVRIMAGLIKWYLATKAWPSRVQHVLSYQRPRDMAIELEITRLNRPVPKHFKTIQASLLCILGRLEGGKKKARVGRWEGEREEPRPRGSRIFRLFYDRPPYDCYFSSFATFGTGVPSGSLFGGERIIFYIGEITSFMYFYTSCHPV